MLGIIYFVSGATGLIYEVLWAKDLAIVFGSAALAHTVVLATFLGGLAIGAAWLGPYADRTPNPLKLYGRLELALAALGLLPALALPFISSAAPALRGVMSALVLLPPTIVMGGTLPALGRHLTQQGRSVGGAASWLYAINSAGAAVGCLLAGYFLIPAYGLDAATLMAAGANAAAGLCALALARRRQSRAPSASTTPDIEWDSRRWILWAAAASGAVSLCYEIGWIRLLALVMGSSVYSFSAMLAAFICGISLGAALSTAGWIEAISPAAAFGLAQLGAGLAVALTIPLYDRLPYVFLILGGIFNRLPLTFYLFEGVKFLLCLALMLAPTMFIGVSLPLAARAASSRSSAGGDLGRLWAFNAAGNVVGAVAAGLWLLPVLGVRGLFALGAAANLAVGVALVAVADWPRRRKEFAIAGATALMLAGAALFPPWDKLMLTRGDFRTPLSSRYPDFESYRQRVHQDALVFYEDDREATVSVERLAWGDLALKVNGKVDASSTGDMDTQLLIAHVPLLMQPGAKDVMIVGLGAGVTAAAALAHDIDRADVVEISPAVARAARLFSPYNAKALDDPRLTLTIEDAKAFLQSTPRRYDLILSEPSNTWIAGVASLFTTEFYRNAKAKLKDGGLYCQWFHLYEMNDQTLALVLRTFDSEFSNVSLWETRPGLDVLLIGSNGSSRAPDAGAMRKEFERPAVSASLARIGARRLSTVLSLQLADDAGVRSLAGAGPVNEDRRPLLEYEAPKVFWLQRSARLPDAADLRLDASRRGRLRLSQFLKSRGMSLTRDEREDWKSYHSQNDPAISALANAW